jgi:hypothetical protein
LHVIRERQRFDKQRGREERERERNTRAKAETAVMWPEAEECLKLPEGGRVKEQIVP